MFTIDQTIASLTGAATLATALATFLTVREIAKQRRATYRPDLVPADEFIQGYIESTKSFGGVRWIKLVRPKVYGEPESDTKVPWHGITFFNLGVAAAKGVEATWTTNVPAICKSINDLAQRCLIPVCANYDNGLLNIEGEDGYKETHVVCNQLSYASPYLLPATVDRCGLAIEVPSFLLTLYWIGLASNYTEEWDKLEELVDFSFVPSAELVLKYSALSGESYTKCFQLRIKHFMMEGKADTESKGRLSACWLSLKLEELKTQPSHSPSSQ